MQIIAESKVNSMGLARGGGDSGRDGEGGGTSQADAEHCQCQGTGPVPPDQDVQCGGRGCGRQPREDSGQLLRRRKEREAQWIGRVIGRNIERRGQFLVN